MGWGSGVNAEGREIGYLVESECDQDGCTAMIDRGLAYRCHGNSRGADVTEGCGRFFCGDHLLFAGNETESAGQLCGSCADAWDAAHPDTDEQGD